MRRLKHAARLGFVIAIMALSVSGFGLQDQVYGDGQTCLSSTAVNSYCVFHEYSGYSVLRDLVLSSDSAMLASTSPETNTTIFSTTEGIVIRELPDSHGYSLAFAPDNRTLAVGSEDKITLWNVSTRQITATLTAQAGGIFSLAFSPDGRFLVSGGEGTIYLWSMPGGELLDFVRDNNLQFVDGIGELVFSPTGEHVISTSIEGGKAWKIEANSRLRFQRGFNPRADTADFSADGELLAMSGVGMDIEIYDAVDFTLIKTIPFQTAPNSNRGTSSLRFTSDDHTIVVGELDVFDYTAGLQMIDVDTSETVRVIEGSGSDIYSLETAFNGQFIIGLSAGVNDYILYWRIE